VKRRPTADEVILARKGAKSRRRITSLRSKTTKARTHVDRLRAANADLKKKLAEALEQQTATSEVLGVSQLPPHSKNESVRPWRLRDSPACASLPNGSESIPGQCSESAALSTAKASSSPSR